jgi:alkylation response protein AidB-like acyl-CoA dehydrogenase
MIPTAAWSVGCGERAIELATAYAKERVQFDKPIGSFQAIAHPLASAATLIAGARLLTLEAAWAHDSGRPFRRLATMAYLEAGDASREATKASQNTFGGIGFTLDIDIQLYFRRSKQYQLAWGDIDALNEEVGAAIIEARA